MFNINDAIYAANILGVTFDKYTIEEFLDGINIELLNIHYQKPMLLIMI